MPLHQPAVNQLRGNDLGWAAEEGVGQGWEMLGVREVGYKSRLEDGGALNSRKSVAAWKRTGEVAASSRRQASSTETTSCFYFC